MSQIDLLGAPDVGGPRDATDRYFTPPWCTRALLDHMGKRIRGEVWEPCAGHCHIADVLSLEAGLFVCATDIVPHPRLTRALDFMTVDPSGIGEPGGILRLPSWIISNPPYTTAKCTATDIVRHALSFGCSVAMLLRVAWLEPCADRYEIFRDDPPTDYVVLPRVNYIGAPSSNNQTSVWFVWDRDCVMPTSCAHVRHYPADIREPTFDWGRL